MRRTKMVRPDVLMDLPDGREVAVVSREALIASLIDFAAIVDISGGVFSLIAKREQTGVPGESVSIAYMLEWKDRTDAREQSEKPTQDPGLFARTDSNPTEQIFHSEIDGVYEPVAVGALVDPDAPEEDNSSIEEG